MAVLAIFSAAGAHWALLQSVAWLRMMAVYAQDRPIAQAVAETFDGEHPCELCLAIKDAKKQEDQQRRTPFEMPGSFGHKLLLAMVSNEPLPAPMVSRAARVALDDEWGLARREAPVAPPPRPA